MCGNELQVGVQLDDSRFGCGGGAAAFESEMNGAQDLEDRHVGEWGWLAALRAFNAQLYDDTLKFGVQLGDSGFGGGGSALGALDSVTKGAQGAEEQHVSERLWLAALRSFNAQIGEPRVFNADACGTDFSLC